MQKKAAAGKVVKGEEDPYGGSTDENTDAEAEQDYPIPELPGTSAFIFPVFHSVSVCITTATCAFFILHRKHGQKVIGHASGLSGEQIRECLLHSFVLLAFPLFSTDHL